MTTVPHFESYAAAKAWVDEGKARVGKRAFTATPEYHAAYPAIVALERAEKAKLPPRRRANRATATWIGENRSANLIGFFR